MSTDRDATLAILASLLVLFSAMLNPIVTIALVVLVLIGMGIRHLTHGAHPRS